MTISEALKEGSSCLSGRKSPLLDCELVLAHALGFKREELTSNSNDSIEESELLMFRSYLERLKSGEPVAYITNSKEFFGHNFFVDQRVLIPRPETELLVERALDFLRTVPGNSRLRILDLGVGSGCISISIAKALEEEQLDVIDQIFAVDVSGDALEVAQLNAQQMGVDHLFQFVGSDLLDFAEEGEVFDLIVTNPPYVPVGDELVEKEVRDFEPNLALFSGEDGMDAYEKIFAQLNDKEIQFSRLLGEFGFDQSQAMQQLLIDSFDLPFKIEKDLAGVDRLVILG